MSSFNDVSLLDAKISNIFDSISLLKDMPACEERDDMERKLYAEMRFYSYAVEFHSGKHGRSEVVRCYRELPLPVKVSVHNKGFLPDWINANDTGKFIGK